MNIAPLTDAYFLYKLIRAQDNWLAQRDHLVFHRDADRAVNGRGKAQCFVDDGIQKGQSVDGVDIIGFGVWVSMARREFVA